MTFLPPSAERQVAQCQQRPSTHNHHSASQRSAGDLSVYPLPPPITTRSRQPLPGHIGRLDSAPGMGRPFSMPRLCSRRLPSCRRCNPPTHKDVAEATVQHIKRVLAPHCLSRCHSSAVPAWKPCRPSTKARRRASTLQRDQCYANICLTRVSRGVGRATTRSRQTSMLLSPGSELPDREPTGLAHPRACPSPHAPPCCPPGGPAGPTGVI